jgi:hypothetical protein
MWWWVESPSRFTAPDRVVQLGYPPGRIDILTSIDGVSWEQVHAGAVAGDYAGVPVRYISRHDLVRNKRATGRAQDVVDAERLERGR